MPFFHWKLLVCKDDKFNLKKHSCYTACNNYHLLCSCFYFLSYLVTFQYLCRSLPSHQMFLLQNDAIVKIQAWARANVAQNDYRKLSMYYFGMDIPNTSQTKQEWQILTPGNLDWWQYYSCTMYKCADIREIYFWKSSAFNKSQPYC